MSSTLTVGGGTVGKPTVVVARRNTSNVHGAAPTTRVPAEVSRDQLYYWTNKWQSDEAESLGELANGEGRVFETSRDAIRWLLDPTTE
jgi:hypothetical protein